MEFKNEKINEAYEFALKAHKGQFRFGIKEPYINHLVATYNIVLENVQQCTTDVLIATLLHDSVEDTKVTLSDISGRFGEKVAEIVALLTKDFDKEQSDGQMKYFKNIALSSEASIIKLADRIHNISRPSTVKGKEWNERYIAESQTILDMMGWADGNLADILKIKIADYKEFIKNQNWESE